MGHHENTLCSWCGFNLIYFSPQKTILMLRSFAIFCGSLALLFTAPAFAANALDDLRAFVRNT
ncbi:MAG: hypothetical protein LBP90_04375, partial [Burkholderiales bacterium]|nr:hypothetical protein [Burkholderiales bacterium]